MVVDGLAGDDHLAENGEGLRELIKGDIASDEGVIEEGGLTVGEGEDIGGLVHLGTG